MRSVIFGCDWCRVEDDADERGHAPSNWEDVAGAGEGGYAALLCPDCIVARERALTAARIERSKPAPGPATPEKKA
jgi:hypothetical protein